MSQITGRDCYCVVGIRHSTVCYLGNSLADAALAFAPGTCFSLGFDEPRALAAALKVSALMKSRQA